MFFWLERVGNTTIGYHHVAHYSRVSMKKKMYLAPDSRAPILWQLQTPTTQLTLKLYWLKII